MSPNLKIKNALKYSTLSLIAVVAVGGVVAYRNDASNTAGRLVSSQDRGVIPTMYFDPTRVAQGFAAPADTHVIFTLPQNVRIQRITFFGGPDYDDKKYWGYCFSGNEEQNKAEGKLGSAIYDGRFFYSLGERTVDTTPATFGQSDLADIKKEALRPSLHSAAPEKVSIAEMFNGGETCYVMSEAILPSGPDTDGDAVNDTRERALDLNEQNPDTDLDGVSDGVELYIGKYNYREPDTDHDGLWDGCEDKNRNGTQDGGETSPRSSDTDRDGLCDGNGFGGGCPEAKKTVCITNADGERECTSRPSVPVYGEDMNQNCKVDAGETDPTKAQTFRDVDDWVSKWTNNQAQLGSRTSTDGSLPIPVLPGSNSLPIPTIPSQFSIPIPNLPTY